MTSGSMSGRLVRRRRRGSTLVEGALAASVLLAFLCGLIVGGLGIARYQKLAAVAREASRWAATHGSMYQQETGASAATAADVYSTVISPQAGLLRLSDLTYTVTWDDASKSPLYYDNSTKTWKRNQVQVALTYTWRAEMYFGTRTLSATSKMPVVY